MCLGQADNTLNEVHRQLCITSSIIQFKWGQHQASQQLSWKSRALMAKFTSKTHHATNWYIAAHVVLSTLDPDGSWASRLQPLNHERDLHLLRREEEDGLDEDKDVWGKGSKFQGHKQGKNQRELSWIWRAQHVGGIPSKVTSADEVNESKFVLSMSLHILIFVCR